MDPETLFHSTMSHSKVAPERTDVGHVAKPMPMSMAGTAGVPASIVEPGAGPLVTLMGPQVVFVPTLLNPTIFDPPEMD